MHAVPLLERDSRHQLFATDHAQRPHVRPNFEPYDPLGHPLAYLPVGAVKDIAQKRDLPHQTAPACRFSKLTPPPMTVQRIWNTRPVAPTGIV